MTLARYPVAHRIPNSKKSHAQVLHSCHEGITSIVLGYSDTEHAKSTENIPRFTQSQNISHRKD